MGRLRYLTAGESHGPALVGILEGLPAGLPVPLEAISHELARRRHGHGRGPRMKVEADRFEVLAGVRGGHTLGSPVAIAIHNSEWAKWSHVMPVEGTPAGRALTRPRPGHADLPGMLKYDFDDARNVLERASARETAARSALGVLAKLLLTRIDITVLSHVVRIGSAAVEPGASLPAADDLAAIDASPVRCFDPTTSAAMVAEIDRAGADGDSLGGIVEVIAYGLPPGLGSHVHWDRKLDGRLAGALMAVPAIKGVEIGDGFEVAQSRGSQAHDEIEPDLSRSTGRAGGTEGGMTIGGTLRMRAAMKPLSTLKKRLRSVDLATGEPQDAFQERTDVCAVPAAGVVCEAVVALVLADAVLEMFGGDTVGDLEGAVERYRERVGSPETQVIVLVGFMGAGKTTVGRRLASLVDKPFVDVDRVIEERAGTSIAQIFERGGEAAFRDLERAVLAQVLSGPEAIVAVGGGALDDLATRAALSHTTVVYLKVGFSEALRRLGGGEGRPMLTLRDPEELYEERVPLYAESATLTIETDGRPAEDIARELGAALGGPAADRPRTGVAVTTPGGSYTVWIGPGLTTSIGEMLPPLPHAEKAFVLTHPILQEMAGPLLDALRDNGLEVHVLVVDEGEGSKSLDTAGSLLTRLAGLRAHRRDVVVGFGGGVVCDLAGFVASTFNRGMPVIHIPTSLLAQVDAAIGGKTGVNLPEGKNLVGTIHQPRAVICDTSLLGSLPDPELRSGMAEVIKYGLIADPKILDLVCARAEDVLERDEATLIELVSRSAAIKASIVEADERETGLREVLNYGHTFGHAIERLAGFSGIRHGEAVALGMMAAAHLAAELDRIDEPAVETHRTALECMGLPVTADLVLEQLKEAWVHDKKYRGGVRFVLLRAIGEPEPGIQVPDDAIARAVRRMSS